MEFRNYEQYVLKKLIDTEDKLDEALDNTENLRQQNDELTMKLTFLASQIKIVTATDNTNRYVDIDCWEQFHQPKFDKILKILEEYKANEVEVEE